MNKVELVFGEWDFLLTFRNHLDQKFKCVSGCRA